MNTLPDFIYFPPLAESMTPVQVWRVAGLPDNKRRVHVSRDPEQAAAGYGAGVDPDFLRPYSETLWQACENFIIWRRLQLDAINAAYRNLPNQMNLFA